MMRDGGRCRTGTFSWWKKAACRCARCRKASLPLLPDQQMPTSFASARRDFSSKFPPRRVMMDPDANIREQIQDALNAGERREWHLVGVSGVLCPNAA